MTDEPLYLFSGTRLLIREQASGAISLPGAGALDGLPVAHHFLLPDGLGIGGTLATDPPGPWRLASLRTLIGLLSEDEFRRAGLAWQWVEWEGTTRFCGRCGGAMVHNAPNCSRCEACDHSAYPVIAPAVIVRIRRDERILLAHNRRFRGGYYSVLAGFVEPGETLEEAAMREIREEVGIEVTNLRYFGSQSWPFPHSLMIGFTAEHRSGEIRVDGEEILHADWFGRDRLPDLPPTQSIAGRLIRDFFDGP